MNMKDLRIFKVAAQVGSINKTAIQLNYVQSNVTTRIKKLESYFNTTLFHRHKSGITLTEEGKRLLPYAQKIIAISEEMKSEVDDEPVGTLQIASVETVIKLPIILSNYLNTYRQVELNLSTGVTASLKEKVLQFQLDGAFVTQNKWIDDYQLNQMEVFQETLVLISSSKVESFEEMMTLPLLRFSDGCGYRAKLDEWLTDKQIMPTKVMELGTLETTLGSVIAGLGVAYVPYSAIVDYERKGLIHCYKLPKKYSQITTSFIYRNNDYMSPALKSFIQTIHNTIAQSEENETL